MTVSFYSILSMSTWHHLLHNWASLRENRCFAYTKTKTQISCVVTAQLICAFVFATWIVPFLYFLNPKFQASSHLLWLYSLVCVGPSRKPRRPVFSQRGSNVISNKMWQMYKMKLQIKEIKSMFQGLINAPRIYKNNNIPSKTFTTHKTVAEKIYCPWDCHFQELGTLRLCIL